MTDAPERIWANVTVWSLDQALAGEWNHCNVNSPEDTEYVRKDATFTADDLRRAWDMGRDAAWLSSERWHGLAVSLADKKPKDKARGERAAAFGLVSESIRALTPPDDLPARVKEGRDE